MAFLYSVRIGLAVLCLIVTVGCSPAPRPVSTPSPVYQCVPEAGGDPALHRSEWIRGLNPPASRRHRAT